MDQIFFQKLEQEKNIQLTKQQREAILHKEGPALILAVPGSGKTTALITRTAYLIYERKVDPRTILSLTFSKAAARDMQKRFRELDNHFQYSQPIFSTIHSFAHQVLRKELNRKGIEYYFIEGRDTPIRKTDLLKQLYYQFNRKPMKEEVLEELANAISFVKNRMLSKKDIQKQFLDIKNFLEIYNGYENYKRKNRYIDFDDMLTLAYGILRKNKRLLQEYRKRYFYIQMDEGQDTSPIQFALVQLLAKPKNNLFIVADDDQSIYGFRGADPQELIGFKQTYPEGKVFFMEENFRSTGAIVDISNQFIRSNNKRYQKDLYTQKERGKPIIIFKANHYGEQMEYLIEELKRKAGQGTTSILFRNHLSAIPLIDVLLKEGIPFSLREGKRYFFYHWVTRDVTSFIHLSLDNTDIKSFENIYYKMNQYISKKTVDLVKKRYNHQSIFDILTEIEALPSYQRKRMYELEKKFYTLGELSPIKALEFIESQLCYGEFLREREKSRPAMIATGEFIFARLKNIAINTSALEEFLSRLKELESWIENASNKKVFPEAPIYLTTLHGAKGLEFDRVYMVDLMQDQIPTYTSVKQWNKGEVGLLEEERRLFYVGMTRAREELTLMSIHSPGSIRQECSQFIGEVHQCLSGEKKEGEDYFHPEEEVRHKKFGRGRVCWIKGKTIAIDFEKYGVKKLAKEYCMYRGILEKI